MDEAGRNCGEAQANELHGATKFAAEFLEHGFIGIKLVENVSYVLVERSRWIHARMKCPQAAWPFL
jgi:hypothetical protein